MRIMDDGPNRVSYLMPVRPFGNKIEYGVASSIVFEIIYLASFSFPGQASIMQGL
jgi:hypothetical protein